MSANAYWLEVYQIFEREKRRAHDRYSGAYHSGGPMYEEKMKQAEKMCRKWSDRLLRMAYREKHERLINAAIKWELCK